RHQCAGAGSALCRGRCRADCTCPPAPTAAAPTAKAPTAAAPTAPAPTAPAPTAAAPRCGDNVVDQANEQCDGADSASCAGACRADCICPPSARAAVGGVEANAMVNAATPAKSKGPSARLEVDGRPAKHEFFRF